MYRVRCAISSCLSEPNVIATASLATRRASSGPEISSHWRVSTLNMKFPGFLLLLFLDSTFGGDRFYVCTARNLKVTESFEVSRLAASIFPCVARGFLTYKFPADMVLHAYKPLCFAIRACFAMTPMNRVTNSEELQTMSNCFTDLWLNFTAMDVFQFYGVPPETVSAFAKDKTMNSMLIRVFACYAALDVESFRPSGNSAIAVLKWIMEKLF